MFRNRRAWLVLAGCLLAGSPAWADPGGWGESGWRGADWRDGPGPWRGADPREGRVSVERFAADGVQAMLGHGAIAVVGAPGSSGDGRQSATFEAAVVDRLARAGYDTVKVDATGGQVAEVQLVRDVVAPAEEKRSPLSGAMEVGVSNRGSMVGMALAYDATKPRAALIETRLEARIRDRTTGRALWEGRAMMVTREGDPHWNDDALAGRLAGALFERFPAGDALAVP